MTYAEKLAHEAYSKINRWQDIPEVFESTINQAMQAQREVDANIAFALANDAIEEVWQGDKDSFTWADRQDLAESISQAILNAEVQP